MFSEELVFCSRIVSIGTSKDIVSIDQYLFSPSNAHPQQCNTDPLGIWCWNKGALNLSSLDASISHCFPPRSSSRKPAQPSKPSAVTRRLVWRLENFLIRQFMWPDNTLPTTLPWLQLELLVRVTNVFLGFIYDFFTYSGSLGWTLGIRHSIYRHWFLFGSIESARQWTLNWYRLYHIIIPHYNKYPAL